MQARFVQTACYLASSFEMNRPLLIPFKTASSSPSLQVVIQRFVGTSSASASLSELLRSIAYQLYRAYESEDERKFVSQLPNDAHEIAAELDRLLLVRI